MAACAWNWTINLRTTLLWRHRAPIMRWLPVTQGAPYQKAWVQYQSDKNLDALIGAVARTYATAPQYAELAEAIAAQSNVPKAVQVA